MIYSEKEKRKKNVIKLDDINLLLKKTKNKTKEIADVNDSWIIVNEL